MGLGYIGEYLPQEWISTFLTDLVNPRQWKTISAKDLLDEGYVVYGANGKIGFYKEFTHEAPTLMITCRGATCGNLHISEPCSYINGNAMALDNQPTNLVGLKFLNYVLHARKLDDVISGSAQPQITRQGLQDVRIPLPPLEEQKLIERKIGSALAQVDSIKTRLDQIPQILKRFRQALLSAAVSGKLTESWRKDNKLSLSEWKVDKAENVCKKVQSGSTPKDNPFDQKGNVPFLKVYNIVNQKIDFDYKPQFITADVHKIKSKRSIAYPNDVLMNIVGPPLGKVALLTEQYPEWNLNQAITLFRVDDEYLLSKYLYYVLCEGSMVRDVLNETKGIVGQINISLTQCREALIPCPSIEEQTEIVARVEKLFAWADNIEKQVHAAQQRVNNLTQSILAKAFRGELTEQWRKDHPDLISGGNSAAALLEKIKTERASQTKKSKKKA